MPKNKKSVAARDVASDNTFKGKKRFVRKLIAKYCRQFVANYLWY